MGMGMGMPSMMPMMTPMSGGMGGMDFGMGAEAGGMSSMAGPMVQAMAPAPTFTNTYTSPPTGDMWGNAQLNNLGPVQQPATEFSAVRNMTRGDGGNQLAVQTLDAKAPGGITPDLQAMQPFRAQQGTPLSEGWATPQQQGTPQIRGLNSEQVRNAQAVDRAFAKAGFSEAQRNALVEQVFRENNFRSDYLYGTHKEHAAVARGRENIGMFSWGDPGRNAAFKAYMRSEGFMDDAGNMVRSEAALDAQARFVKQEMQSYPRTVNEFLNNPNVDINQARITLGDDYIKWARTNPTYASHAGRMAAFGSQISALRGGGQAPFAPVTQASAALPRAAYTTAGNAVGQALVQGMANVSAQYTAPVAEASISPVTTPVETAPTVSAAQAIEQAFNPPADQGMQNPEAYAGRADSFTEDSQLQADLAARAQNNLVQLQNQNGPIIEAEAAAEPPTQAEAQITTPEPVKTPAQPVQASTGAGQKAPVSRTEPRTRVKTPQGVSTPRPVKNNAPVTASSDYLDPMNMTRSIGPGRQGTATDLFRAFSSELEKAGFRISPKKKRK
jgi:hypothetical protein